ncbi:MAG: family N-acetyltransferase, partial [Jatrophihabitantaceae bacterium]|nr:family N-acetyltransferase [Jatrophihabitantaceae bacterium]
VHTAAFSSAPRSSGFTGSGEVAEAWLADRLRDTGALPALSLVAVIDGAVAGHVVGSRGTLAGQPSVGLGPIGVLPYRQRDGIGSALMHAVIGAADALDEPAVLLLGSPDYYGRFGFVLAVPLGLEPPDASWGEHFQVRTLRAWDPFVRGAFAYAAAFDEIRGA